MSGIPTGLKIGMGAMGIAGIGGLAYVMTRGGDDDKVKEAGQDAPKDAPVDGAVDPATGEAAAPSGETAPVEGTEEVAAAPTGVLEASPMPTGVTAGTTDTGYDATAAAPEGNLISPEDYAAALLAAQGGAQGAAATGSMPLEQTRYPVSTYPNDYNGVISAIDRAAPQTWSTGDVMLVGDAARRSGSSPSQASRMVREVYNSTPYSWSGNSEAQVAATGLTTFRDPTDTGDVIDQVEYGTPWNWSTSSDVRLSIAALHGRVPTNLVDDVIRDSANSVYGESSGVALAEQRLLGGGYGSGYIPDSGGYLPDYGGYVPDYGSSYPGYPSYPSYPDTSPGDSGYGYPSYPSYPDTSPGDSGYGYPDSGGYSGGYTSPGDSGGFSSPSYGDGGYGAGSGYTSGGDS